MAKKQKPPQHTVYQPINPYWDGITALSLEETVDFNNESIQRSGFIQTIIMEENRLFASRENDEIEEIIREDLSDEDDDEDDHRKEKKSSQFWNYILSRKWIDVLSGSFFVAIPEIALKFIGALFVDLNVAAKSKATDPSSSGLWYIPWAITSILNVCVAQPLFFVANILLHARTVLDGAAMMIKGLFSPKTLWSGIKGLCRGIACLAIDAISVGIMAGAAIGCSLIFQPHLAAGILPAIVGAQSAIAGVVSGVAQATVVSVTGAITATAAVSNHIVTSRPLTSTSGCLQAFSTQPNMVASEDEEQLPAASVRSSTGKRYTVRTTGFGFYPVNKPSIESSERAELEELSRTARP